MTDVCRRDNNNNSYSFMLLTVKKLSKKNIAYVDIYDGGDDDG